MIVALTSGGLACITSGSHTLQNRSYLAFVPDTDRFPVLFVFHGWAMSAESQYKEDRLGDVLPARDGWAVVYPDGERDVPSRWLAEGSDWRSWNGAGTTGSPGELGATCSPTADRVPCYESCGTCADRCWWTTCRDDVAFVASLMASLPCATRFAATGFSNGAIFLYELASRPETAPLLDAVIPVAGLPHKGFLRNTTVPLFGLWGRVDTFVPPGPSWDPINATLSADGWYYVPAANVTGALLGPWPTPFDGEKGLACSHGTRAAGCFWDGEHEWAGHGSAVPLATRWVAFVLASLPRRTEALAAVPGGGWAAGSVAGFVAALLLVAGALALGPAASWRRPADSADHYVRLL